MCAVVFSETGLLLGFFLPGDSFLFTVGVVAGAGRHNIFLIQGLLLCAAVIGNATGYLLGRKTGPAIFDRPDSRLFKREHLLQDAGVLRKARRQDDHLRAVCPHHPYLRALRGRRGTTCATRALRRST